MHADGTCERKFAAARYQGRLRGVNHRGLARAAIAGPQPRAHGVGSQPVRRSCDAVRSFAVVSVLAAGPLACTRVSDRERFTAGGDALEIVEAYPAPGSADVAGDVQIDLCFSAYLDPRSVGAGDATVTSGVAQADVEVAMQILPWRGPGGSVLVGPAAASGPWCEGSVVTIAPKAELVGGLLYRLRLAPRARGWAGEPLDTDAAGWTVEDTQTRYYLEFRTREADGASDTGAGSGDDGGTTGAGEDDGDPAPTLDDLFAPGMPFDPARDTCGCHRDPEDVPGQLLDLRTPDAAYADLVLATRARDTGFPMVSPRRPSESFLVHKLLRTPDGTPLHGLLGDAMPKDGELPYADFVAIARWIEAGAPR